MSPRAQSTTKSSTKSRKKQIAVIIGAGPAGLTTAFELLQQQTNIHPIIFEGSQAIGGISQTINYKGNRMDIGGHRFFSKSDRVMNWWQQFMPMQKVDGDSIDLTYHKQKRTVKAKGTANPEDDDVMLVRQRLSRIYFLKQFFDYPIALNKRTIQQLGPTRMAKIGASYSKARLAPIKPEKSLEDFIINRFGKELYETFFKSYTEKVWGVPCDQIPADWGAQRIKGLSITKVLQHAITKPFKSASDSISQKTTETSLIEQFLYPKYGPGHLWEVVAKRIQAMGGEIHMQQMVTQIHHQDGQVTAVTIKDEKTGQSKKIKADYVFSTMPVKDLIAGFVPAAPPKIAKIAKELPYRDFITVGLLVKKLALADGQGPTNLVPDNWIYIQEHDVKLGRLQIFNNWSPYLVKDPNTVWLGLEYFCYEGDELWQKSDKDMLAFAKKELAHIGIIDENDFLDGTVVRVKKTYPAYFGAYAQFDQVKKYTDKFSNLFLLGRNGMHRYNNADHSMLTAMTAVDNIVKGQSSKANIWDVNTEDEYHEQK